MNWEEALLARIGEHYDRLFASGALPTESQVEFVVRALGVRAGQPVLDLYCGPGRHALALARRGIRVTGVDRSPALLAEARRRARAMGLQVHWLEADARVLPPIGPFAGAVSLRAPWAYRQDPVQDRQVLARVAERLLPGARLLLDLPNAAWLERCPAGSSLVVAGGVAVREVRDYDVATRTLRVTWRVHQPGRPAWTTRVACRVLPLQELEWMLARCGLVLESAFGGFDGAPLSPDRPRCILLARRPVLPALGAGPAAG